MNPPLIVSINLPADLYGELDKRPNTWGRADVRQEPYTFLDVPAGHRVRILKIEGDLISNPRHQGNQGTYCNVLWGLCRTSVTEQGKSKTLQYGSDGCFVYVQDTIAWNGRARTAFNRSFPEDSPDGLLDEDHTFLNKIAIYLNEIEARIHLEATANITFRYEEAQQ